MTNKSFVIQRYEDKKRIKNYISKTKKGLREEERKIILKHIPKNSRILVVGCGTGREIYGLLKDGFKNIEGLDISKKMLKEAKKILPKIKFHCSDINKFNSNKKFDCVLYLNNVIEQIPSEKDREKVILKSNELLKKGGIVIITTHSRFFAGELGKELIKTGINYILYFLKIKKKCPFEYIDKKNKIYAYYSNPLNVRKFIKKGGFRILEINSKKGIIRGKKSFFWIFNEPVYYVFRRN